MGALWRWRCNKISLVAQAILFSLALAGLVVLLQVFVGGTLCQRQFSGGGSGPAA